MPSGICLSAFFTSHGLWQRGMPLRNEMTQTIISKLSEMIPSFEASPFCSTSSSSRSITSILVSRRETPKKTHKTNLSLRKRQSVGWFFRSFLVYLTLLFQSGNLRRLVQKGDDLLVESSSRDVSRSSKGTRSGQGPPHVLCRRIYWLQFRNDCISCLTREISFTFPPIIIDLSLPCVSSFTFHGFSNPTFLFFILLFHFRDHGYSYFGFLFMWIYIYLGTILKS